MYFLPHIIEMCLRSSSVLILNYISTSKEIPIIMTHSVMNISECRKTKQKSLFGLNHSKKDHAISC